MTSTRTMLAWLTVLTLSFTCVLGVTLGREDLDFEILTVSRQVSDDYMETTIEVEFTANKQPDAKWWYYDDRVFDISATMEYADGRGKAAATFESKQHISLEIGYLYSHTLRLVMKWDIDNSNMTQTLNTQWATTTANDVAYAADDSFDVTMVSQKHIAQGFTWSKFWENDEYDVRLSAYYVDPDTAKIEHTDFFEDDKLRNQVNAVKTLGEDTATLEAVFTMGQTPLNGYVEQFTIYKMDDSDAPYIVRHIWETMHINVHEESIPGPFPEGYASVTTSSNDRYCDSDDYCFFYCYGYANDIVAAQIFKEVNGTLQEHVNTEVSTIRNENRVVFYVDLHSDRAGNYVCRITARDNTTAETLIRVYEYEE